MGNTTASLTREQLFGGGEKKQSTAQQKSRVNCATVETRNRAPN